MARGPGIVYVAVLTGLAVLIARWTHPFGAAAAAVLLGWLVARGDLAPLARPGVDWSVRYGLLAAVALLGFSLDLGAILTSGLRWLGMAVSAVLVSWLVAQALGRAFGVPAGLRGLLGIGTGICGLSAMAAAQPALGAPRHHLAPAAAAVTVLGSIGLVLLPVLQWSTGLLGDEAFGAWAGATLHAVPQAIGAGLAGGGLTGAQAATSVKMARVALLVPAVLALAWHSRRQVAGKGSRVGWPSEVKDFAIAVVLGNLLPWPDAVLEAAQALAGWILVAAMAALGLQTRLRDLGHAGAWATAVGTWLALLAVGLLWL